MRQVYILGGLRSYIGLCNSMYRHIPAEFLGAKVLKNLKEKYKIEDKDIDYIINVLVLLVLLFHDFLMPINPILL